MSLLLPSRPEKRIAWWLVPLLLVVSVGVHGVVVALVVLSSVLAGGAPKKKVESRPVSLRRLDAATWSANRGAARAAQPLERPAPLHPAGQVVDVAPGNNRRPDDAKYLAETNNTVEKETRAKNQVSKYSRATAKTTEHPEQLPSAKGEVPQSSAPPPSGVSLAESVLGRRTAPTLFPSSLSGTGTEDSPPAPVGTAAGSSAGGSDVTEGGGAPNDALDGVAEGDGTFLNTREWRYASFFNRVKQAVSAKWDPNGRLKRRGDRGLGAPVRTTLMHVALRPDGSLADLYVAKSSGLDELDAEAMGAFTRAAPFANPPPALVENGYIRFQFSFQVTEEGLVSSPFRFR
ncbi:MAG: TonB family protein [Myxococcota bacterium]